MEYSSHTMVICLKNYLRCSDRRFEYSDKIRGVQLAWPWYFEHSELTLLWCFKVGQ